MHRRSFHNNITFRIAWPLLFGTLLYLLILLLNNNLSSLGISFFSQELLFTILTSVAVFEGARVTLMVLKKQRVRSLVMNILIRVGTTSLVTGVIVFLLVSVYFKFILGYSAYGSFTQEMNMFLFLFVPAGMVYTILVVGNFYLFEENKELVEQEKILAENLELELIRYQNEVNPDLLYDSLESLISLIHKDPFEAEDYIDQLAMVYRHILSNKHAELTELSSEIKTAENVIALFNVKYSGLIQLTNTLPSVKEILVIPGVLSRLVESVIRSSIISPVLPLQITIEYESDTYFVLRYRLNERLGKVDRLGIKDIQNAYSIFEKPVVTVKAYGEHFIKIPILEMEKSMSKQAV